MIFLILMLLFFISNNYLVITKYRLRLKSAEKGRKPLSIVHISDLHNKNFGIRQSYLICRIRSLHPDLIAVTGDLVHAAAFRNAALFIQKASRICPVYYIRGNHESEAGNYAQLENILIKYGVHILKNESAVFVKNGSSYHITGLDDPCFRGYDKNYSALMHQTLKKMASRMDVSGTDCRILLSHRPELFHLYSSYPFDLVLCGHAHGGQFRLPGTDGLFAPNQGIFPKYASGMHTENGTSEIISRGLGNSAFPLRLFNFPEIVHITIK